MIQLKLNPKLDLAGYARAFARNGVVQIPNILEPQAAEALAEVLTRGTPWELALSTADGGAETIPGPRLREMGPQGLRPKVEAVVNQARQGFAFVYLCYPMIEALVQGRDPGHPLHAMTEFLNTPEFRGLGASVIGDPGVSKVDAQATWYRPGDFLTLHDDAGKGERLAAYTLGFTKGWRPDWGGQLLFHDDAGQITRGLAPGFNVLTLFKVPRLHSVAPVASYAGAPRLSITGWLRNDPPTRAAR